MARVEIISTFGVCMNPLSVERLLVDTIESQASFGIGQLVDPLSTKGFAPNDQEPHRTWTVASHELEEFVVKVFAAIAAPEVLVGGHQTVTPRTIVKWQGISVNGFASDGEFDAASAEPDAVLLQRMLNDPSARPSIKEWCETALARNPHSRPTAVRRLVSTFVQTEWSKARSIVT